MNSLLQKHFAILAMSGAGKSYLSSVLIEELLDRKKEQGRVAVIIVDVHGEYLGFKSGAYAKQTEIFSGKKIKISLRKVSPQFLAELMPELSAAQKREAAVLLSKMRESWKQERKAYDLDDLMSYIEASGMKDNIKGTLLAWISALKRLRVLGKADHPNIDELAQPGKLSILDLSDIDNQRKKQIIVTYFAKRLFKQRKAEKIPPFLLLIEESHNFAREKAAKEYAISKPIIETIAREGRKFGASLCLVSQRPVQLSTTALSQANTHIIMRVTNPYDIDHIGKSCEGIDKYMLQSITTLRTGEALIVGEAVRHPVFVKIRKRKSRDSPKGQSIEKIAQRFEEISEKKTEDVTEAFL